MRCIQNASHCSLSVVRRPLKPSDNDLVAMMQLSCPHHLQSPQTCSSKYGLSSNTPSRQQNEFVSDMFPADGMIFVRDDRPVVSRGCIEPGGPLDSLLDDLIEVSIGVDDRVHRSGMGLVHHDRVVGTIDGRVNPHTEDVLVSLSQKTATHHVPLLVDIAGVDIHVF